MLERTRALKEPKTGLPAFWGSDDTGQFGGRRRLEVAVRRCPPLWMSVLEFMVMGARVRPCITDAGMG